MIPKASQRAGGQDLATHLLNAYDNEIVEVDHVRGAIADDLHGAFKEWEVQAATLTRCEQYLYSLSINPDPAQSPLTRDQYMDYIARAELSLGLGDQPRAVVFHTKYGREHCHVVWSRIDPERQKAVHLAFNHEKLMNVTRAFARDHGLKLPDGYEKSRGADKESLYDREKERQTGLSKDDHARVVTDAWRRSDSAAAFVRALQERGYLLATGSRDYVLVDTYGGMHALVRLIDDSAVRTKDVRARLGKEFPKDALPSVEEAQALVRQHQGQAERTRQDEQQAMRLAGLAQQQAVRRAELEREIARLGRHHQAEAVSLRERHGQERDALRLRQRHAETALRRTREERAPRGLAGFLAQVSGVALIRRALQWREDTRRMTVYVDERKALRTRQRGEARALDQRAGLQAVDSERRRVDLAKVEARERRALERDSRREARERERGGDDVMPPLSAVLELVPAMEAPAQPPHLLEASPQAQNSEVDGGPDLLAAFAQAAEQSGEEQGRPIDTRQADQPAPVRDEPTGGRER